MCRLLAVAGGLAIVLDIGLGTRSHTVWVLIGPLPFYAVGLLTFWSRPDNLVVRWLLAAGAFFATGTFLGDTLLALRPGSAVSLVAQWATLAGVLAIVGLVGLFPVGRPSRPVDHFVLRLVGVQVAVLPVLGAMSNATLLLHAYAEPGTPSVASPFFVSGLAPLGPLADQLFNLFPLWTFAGVGLLALRYRQETAPHRRQIRLLIVGCAVGLTFSFVQVLIDQLGSDALAYRIASVMLWPLSAALVLGSLLFALFYEGVFGIDRPARRRHVHAVLRGLIVLALVGVAAGFGLIAATVAGTGIAVVLAVAAAIALQPVRGRLERLADRWMFGARLDGYGLLARFGAVLERAPGRARVLEELADTVRHGLDLTWARARLDDAVALAGDATETPAALTVAIRDGDHLVGRIECGPRRDGNPLLAEDRRLLGSLAGQAAAAARNLRLADQLAERLSQIELQAAELTASRGRVVAAQDAERRRIQRDLHDGVQQEVVALTAKLGLARQRLGRGDPSGERLLAELQDDLGGLLRALREVAYAIHPPILADRGLLPAVEAQAARLPVAMAVRADPALRDVRYPARIEATAWYALAEALSNVVKHADASQVEVSLARPDGRLTLEVRDDGRGFDAGAARGLGLTGLADRLDIVGGTLVVDSRSGKGTTVRMDIPLGPADE